MDQTLGTTHLEKAQRMLKYCFICSAVADAVIILFFSGKKKHLYCEDFYKQTSRLQVLKTRYSLRRVLPNI